MPTEPPDSQAQRVALQRWLGQHPELRVIAVFAALPGEVDLAELVVSHPQCCWVYPRVTGSSLVFHVVENPRVQLVAGAFGIHEPASHLAEIPLERIDAFLCPGLGFDPHGGRLGRGHGYYDRMLAGARADALKVGVCFPYQKVADTFAQAHDVRMDWVVSG